MHDQSATAAGLLNPVLAKTHQEAPEMSFVWNTCQVTRLSVIKNCLTGGNSFFSEIEGFVMADCT